MKSHHVYRCYGDDGDLLYVGLTIDPARRWTDHGRNSPWWPQVARIESETYSRGEAWVAERELIKALRPKHNLNHHPDRVAEGCTSKGWETRRALYGPTGTRARNAA